MTTLAYKDGVLAGDTRAFGFDKAPVGSKTKVYRLTDGRLVGVSTACVGLPKAVREWIEAGMKSDALPCARDRDKLDFDALIISPDGSCVLLDGNFLPSDPVMAPYYAAGSGANFALAAMLLGQSAEEAVVTASKLDAWTGPDVLTVTHSA